MSKSFVEIDNDKWARIPYHVVRQHKAAVVDSYPDDFRDKVFRVKIRSNGQVMNLDRLLRFIILYYDHRSPLQEIHDQVDKVNTALHYSGFRRVDGNWPDNVLDVVHGKNAVFNLQVLSYIMKNGGGRWAVIQTMERRLFDNLAKILSDKKGEYDGLLKKTQELQDDLEERKRAYLGELYNLETSGSYEKYFIKEKLMIAPEDVAGLIEVLDHDLNYEEIFSEADEHAV